MKRKNSFFENIFSIRNDESNRKVLTFLGLKLKIKNSSSVNPISIVQIEELKKFIVKNPNFHHKLDHLLMQNEVLLQTLGELNYNDKNILNKKVFSMIPKASGTHETLQKVLYILLCAFKDICEKNNITYWIQAGTLLGAYRHNGWIPWDDDLDVGMLESDLRKLKEILKDHPIFKIEDYYHFRKDYVGRFTRFRLKDDSFKCFLDIPVYEYYDGDNIDDAWKDITLKREEFVDRALELSSRLSRVYQNKVITDEHDLKLVQEFYDKEIETMHKTDGKFIYWASYSVPPLWKRIFTKETFFPTKKLTFETEEFAVPNEYEQYIETQYGNVFKCPMDRKLKHVKAFDLHTNIEEALLYLEENKDKI